MNLRSQLIELQITDKDDNTTRYYTYDGYYNQKDRLIIRDLRKSVEKRTFICASFFGIVGYYVSKKIHLPTINIKSMKIPLQGLLSGLFVYCGVFLLFDSIAARQIANFQKKKALSCKHLPLWKNKTLAVNPDRAFFQLDDSRNNEITIFHSGLTPEAAARLIPDKIIGTIPQKPVDPKYHQHKH